MFSLGSWLPGLAWGWMLLDALLQGLVGACAVSVLCSLLKVYLYLQCLNDPEGQAEKEAMRAQRRVLEPLHVLVLTGLLALVGSRVAALVVLEFSLRTMSTLLSLGKDGWHGENHVLLCMRACLQLCIPLLHAMPEALQGAAAWRKPLIALSPCIPLQFCSTCKEVRMRMAGMEKSMHHFACMSAAMHPLTAWYICGEDEDACLCNCASSCCHQCLWGSHCGGRILAEEPQQSSGRRPVFQTVLVRMGGLFILLLTVGHWVDIFHVLISLLGELWCLLHARVMLEACWRQ
ncbi:TMM82 protein, partial [Probosciger aterrimus]|nr:TMM82 protein [Probosciger aterrimus]